jgi:hypothetical protein
MTYILLIKVKSELSIVSHRNIDQQLKTIEENNKISMILDRGL